MAEIEQEWSTELKRGSIQLCLLALLSREQKYGFQIIKELRELSDGYFDLKEGTLYPALHRLEKKGYLESRWVMQTEGLPRKYYRLTGKGAEVLIEAKKEWERMIKGCKNVLEVGK